MPRIVSPDMTITRTQDDAPLDPTPQDNVHSPTQDGRRVGEPDRRGEREYEWVTPKGETLKQSLPLRRPCLVVYDPATQNLRAISLDGTVWSSGMQVVEVVD